MEVGGSCSAPGKLHTEMFQPGYEPEASPCEVRALNTTQTYNPVLSACVYMSAMFWKMVHFSAFLLFYYRPAFNNL